MRNYSIEEILGKSSAPCNWKERGCPSEPTLAKMSEHTRGCQYRPPVVCYFGAINGCKWYGEGDELTEHLFDVHEVEPLNRKTLVRYLWNPPEVSLWRFRFRTVHFEVDKDAPPETYILEHYYCRNAKILAFLLRDPTGKSTRSYTL
jgi:hypothetical protein